jgi:hypothetical protein
MNMNIKLRILFFISDKVSYIRIFCNVGLMGRYWVYNIPNRIRGVQHLDFCGLEFLQKGG